MPLHIGLNFLPEAERRTWRSREGVWLPENIEVYIAILITVLHVFCVHISCENIFDYQIKTS